MDLSGEDTVSIWEGPESSCNAGAMGPHASTELILPLQSHSFFWCVYFELKNDRYEKGSIAQLSVQVINSQTNSVRADGRRKNVNFLCKRYSSSHQGVFYLANLGYGKLLFPCWENAEC